VTELRWTDTAVDDLTSIRDFIARESPLTAHQVIERLVTATNVLRDFPNSGRIVPERPDSAFRELIRAPYRIVYENTHGAVTILTFFHSARRFPEGLDEAAR
jgi:toxin ParE1/3/4